MNILRVKWGVGGTLAAGLIFPFCAAAQAPPNNVEATTAPVNKPAGVAYDSAGNLYIAVLNDHVIRKVDLNGIITTVVGTGEEGFGGDGGAATAAQLDSPAGVALDAAGNLYIADSHNHRIREVVNGVITTIAGTGTPGFSGDGAAATAAQLNLPVAVSVDASGNLYIADANNHRIRRITGATVTTVAGNGEEAFSGDNGPAISAGLDTPNGVAADTLVAGRFYIGDTHNQRIRAVDASGVITTLAGTGAKTYTGEGTAASAALARPRGLAVDSSGTVYLADSDNHRIRSITNGTVTTVAGNGEESFSGDTGLARNAALDTPRATAVSLTGSIALTDTNNQRIRSVALSSGTTDTVAGFSPTSTESLLLAGPTSVVYGTGSLTATFANGSQIATGSLTILEGTTTVSSAALSSNTSTLSLATLAPGQHTLVATYAGDAANAAIASGVYLVNVAKAPLTATANSINVLYGQPIPTPTGTLTGVLSSDAANVAAVFSTSAVQGSPVATVPIIVAVTGSAASRYTVALAADSGSVVIAQAGTKTTLTTSSLTPNLTAPITLTATVASLTTGTPTGSIQFFGGSSQLASVALSAGAATYTTSALPVGASAITAQYIGDPNFTASTSNTVSETVGGNGDFTLTPVTTTPPTTAIVPGTSATFHFTVAPISPVFNLPIVFTATGLPAGATATFSPSTATLGSHSTNLTMTVQTTFSSAELHLSPLLAGSSLSVAFLLLPFGAKLRRRARVLHFLGLSSIVGLSLGAVMIVTGCSTGNGFFGRPQQTYTIQVIGTATTPASGIIQHATTVTLTIQ